MATSSASGYEFTFLDPVEDFECPLCLHVTREPTLTGCCGQHFCQACISRITSGSKPCPFCKSTGFSVLFDKKQNRKVLLLKIKCLKKARGCIWVGKLGSVDDHLSGDCMYTDVNCSYSCGKTMQKRRLTAHLKMSCPHRPFACKHCKYEATYNEICSDHYPECSEFPVSCPNNCDIRTVVRKNLEKHLATCPCTLVNCEFSHAGCCEEIKRKDLASHMEEQTQKHLTLLSALSLKTITELQQQSEKATIDLKRQSENLATLQQQVLKLEKEKTTLEEIILQQEEKLVALEKRVLQLEKENEIEKQSLKAGPIAPFEFKIENFDAFSKSKNPFNSPVFYTAPKGCRIRLRCAISTPKSTQIRYGYEVLQLQVEQVAGSFDDWLQWPIQCTVTAVFLDQTSPRCLQSSVKCIKLNKPDEHNTIVILDEFRLSNITTNFVKKDSVLIRVDVQIVE